MAQFEAAIAHLDAQKERNYTEAANKFGMSRSALTRRYLGQSVSRAESASINHQRLNNVQEDTLLGYIDTLTNRHLPPTTQIIKNLAEEIAGGPVGKNWTARFIQRHSKRICSPYLRPLDHKRASAESVPTFEHFYKLVLLSNTLLPVLY